VTLASRSGTWRRRQRRPTAHAEAEPRVPPRHPQHPRGRRRAHPTRAAGSRARRGRCPPDGRAVRRQQQQRMNLAMGVVHGPSIVVLDEPTAGVDIASRLGDADEAVFACRSRGPRSPMRAREVRRNAGRMQLRKPRRFAWLVFIVARRVEQLRAVATKTRFRDFRYPTAVALPSGRLGLVGNPGASRTYVR
jgi:hypothetical protein